MSSRSDDCSVKIGLAKLNEDDLIELFKAAIDYQDDDNGFEGPLVLTPVTVTKKYE